MLLLCVLLPLKIIAQDSPLIINTNLVEDYTLLNEEYLEVDLLKHYSGFNLSFSTDQEEATIFNYNQPDILLPSIDQNKILKMHGNPNGFAFVLDTNNVMTVYNISKKDPKAKDSSDYMINQKTIDSSIFIQCFDFDLSSEIGLVVDCYDSWTKTNYFFVWDPFNPSAEILKIKNTVEPKAFDYLKRKLLILNDSSSNIILARGPIRNAIIKASTSDEIIIFSIYNSQASVLQTINASTLNISILWIQDFDVKGNQTLIFLHGEYGLFQVLLQNNSFAFDKFDAIKNISSFSIIQGGSSDQALKLVAVSNNYTFRLDWSSIEFSKIEYYYERPHDPVVNLEVIAIQSYLVLLAKYYDSVETAYRGLLYTYKYDVGTYFRIFEAKINSLEECAYAIHPLYDSLLLFTESQFFKFSIQPPTLVLGSKSVTEHALKVNLKAVSYNSFSIKSIESTLSFNISFYPQGKEFLSANDSNSTVYGFFQQSLEYKISNLKPVGPYLMAVVSFPEDLNITKIYPSYYDTKFLGGSTILNNDNENSGEINSYPVKKYIDVEGFDISFLPRTNFSSILFSQLLRPDNENIFVWAIQLINLTFITSRCYESRAQLNNYFRCQKIFKSVNLTNELVQVLEIYNQSNLVLGLRFINESEIKFYNYKTMQLMKTANISGLEFRSTNINIENDYACISVPSSNRIRIFRQQNFEELRNISSADFINLDIDFLPITCRILNENFLFIEFENKITLVNLNYFLKNEKEKLMVSSEIEKNSTAEITLFPDQLALYDKELASIAIYFLKSGRFVFKTRIAIPRGEIIEKHFSSPVQFGSSRLYYIFTKSTATGNETRCMRILDISRVGLNQFYFQSLFNSTLTPLGVIAIDGKSEFIMWNVSVIAKNYCLPALGKIINDPSIYMVLTNNFTAPVSLENITVMLSTGKLAEIIPLNIKYTNNRADIEFQPERQSELDNLLTITDPVKDYIEFEAFNFSSGVVLDYELECYDCYNGGPIRLFSPLDVYTSVVSNIFVYDIEISDKRIFIQSSSGIVVMDKNLSSLIYEVAFNNNTQCYFIAVDHANDSFTISFCLSGLKSVLIFTYFTFNDISKVPYFIEQEINAYNIRKMDSKMSYLFTLTTDGSIIIYKLNQSSLNEKCSLFKIIDAEYFDGLAETGLADFILTEEKDPQTNLPLLRIFLLGRSRFLVILTVDSDFTVKSKESIDILNAIKKQTLDLPFFIQFSKIDVVRNSTNTLVYHVLVGISNFNSFEFQYTLNKKLNALIAVACYLRYSSYKTGSYLKILYKEGSADSFIFQTIIKGSLVKFVLYERDTSNVFYTNYPIKSGLSYDYAAEPAIYPLLEKDGQSYFKILVADYRQKRLLTALARKNITFMFRNSTEISTKELTLKLSNDEKSVSQYIKIYNKYWVDPPPELEPTDQNKWIFGLLAGFIVTGFLCLILSRKLRVHSGNFDRVSVLGDIMFEPQDN